MAIIDSQKLALALLLLAVPACAPGGADIDDDQASDRDDAIIAGTTASAYPEAVLVDMYEGGQLAAYCSGSLIAPKVVLTAGHCVHNIEAWRIKAPFASGQTANASDGETYDWDTDSEAVDPSMHDIGLVYLDSPITLSSYPTIASAHVTFGSKATNIGRIHNGSVSTTKLYIGKQVALSDGATLGFPLSYASSDVIESGDSGGPVLKAGTHQIVAVNSGAGGNTQVLARTDLLATWIAQKIAAHGGSTGTSSGSGGSTSSGAGASSSASGGSTSSCGSIDFAGTCAGNTVKWCENDALHQISCNASGKTCGFDEGNGYYNCL